MEPVISRTGRITGAPTLGGVVYSRDGDTGSWRVGTGYWLLVPLVLMYRGTGNLGDDTPKFFFLGGGFWALMAWSSRDAVSGGYYAEAMARVFWLSLWLLA